MSNDILDQMRVAFRAEAHDLLIELDSALLALEEEPGSSALVHRVFRAIHTIKGSGATAGFTHLARFAHQVEEAFDLAREGRLAVTPDLIDCALRACDVVRLILEDQSEGTVEGEDAVAEAFRRLLPVPANTGSGVAGPTKPEARIRTAYEIVFKPNREMFYSGADPVTLLDDLRELGQAHIKGHVDQVPPVTSLEPEQCYLWWEILLVTNSDEAAIQEVFVFVEDECELLIRRLDDQTSAERDTLLLENAPGSREHLDAVFRGVHSVKGNAGVLLGQVKGGGLLASHPLNLMLRMAHALESLLDPFREPQAGAAPKETVQTALEACDSFRVLLGSLTHKGGSAVSSELLLRLGVQTEAAPGGSAVDGRLAAFLNTTSQCVEMIEGCLKRLENDTDSPQRALETYLRGIRTLSAAARYQNFPALEDPLAQQLRILEAAMKGGAALSAADRSELGKAFDEVRSVLDSTSPASGAVEASKIADRAPSAPKSTTGRPDAPDPPATIRIDQNKIDRLMRVVGELLVARGAFPVLAHKLNTGAERAGLAKDLKEAGSNISRMAEELQSCVMSIRMLPVKTVFQRFPRLVRDLARSLGKEVRLVIEGEGIELDKTILERIGDPLVHVIRNAVDHGLETPAERRAKGKEESGQLTLRASHEAGGVVIEISDDGRGLDAGALKRKAIERGLLTVEEAAAMSDEAVFQLVFLPGLSTAAKVTEVSGRGVGMDVVLSNVRSLQGSIDIRSKSGLGSAFIIKLPTSLMVSKGILLVAGAQEYILPMSNILDMVKLPAEEAHEYRGLTIAQVRGNIYPIVTLADVLGLASTKKPELSIAIVEAGTFKYGLAVDRFLSEVEILVKPLPGGLEDRKEFQGAAIMGDGRVVLVLNAMEFHRLSNCRSENHQH